jgi:hypothetical protein
MGRLTSQSRDAERRLHVIESARRWADLMESFEKQSPGSHTEDAANARAHVERLERGETVRVVGWQCGYISGNDPLHWENFLMDRDGRLTHVAPIFDPPA